jgi:hypothetical protein
MATFSSKQYSWADMTISYGGRILEGVMEVEYKETKEKEYLYGRGAKPHAIVHGNMNYEGKIKVWQSELEAMTKDAKDKDINNLSFDIVVAYVPRDNDGQIITDILKNVEFMEVTKSMTQGATNMEVELPIMFLDVKRQA